MRLISYILEKEIKFGWGFSIKNAEKKALLQFYYIETAKISYGWGLNLFKMLK